jgi:putative nucleotidyltransferase with HDIG domain
MKEDSTNHYARVEDLRVGMFIHLEGGWLAHPFPLSNFKLGSPQQIATLRSLRLAKVRWSPDKSDLEHPAEAAAAPEPDGSTRPSDVADGVAVGGPADKTPAAGAAAETDAPGTAAMVGTPGVAGVAGVAGKAGKAGKASAMGAADMVSSICAAPEPPELVAERGRRLALATQREAMQHCQRQFSEATSACRTLTELVPSKPQLAREQSEALSRAFVDKMLVQGESCIRLLGEVAGDKASTHAVNVTVLSLLLGKAFGLAKPDMFDLGVGAVLHDIGKLDVPERLRHSDGQLSTSEAMIYQEHVVRGVAHARRMGLSDGARQVIEQHHEHADGGGFPLRLGGDRLSTAARIVALVNRYDNLCNPNVPSHALTPHEALSLLFAQGKSRFDATILGGFIKMMGIYPPGSAVQLTDDRYALVVSVNSNRPLKPRVLVHDRAVPPDEALLLDLEAEPQLGIRRSLKPIALPREALDYLSPRPRTAYFFETARELEVELSG